MYVCPPVLPMHISKSPSTKETDGPTSAWIEILVWFGNSMKVLEKVRYKSKAK